MARPYSMDLRERVVASVETGKLSRRQAASRFGVGVSTAINWVRRFRETGSVAPGQMGGHKPKAIRGAHRDCPGLNPRGWMRKTLTLRGLVAELAERGLKVDYRTMWSFVHGENLSFKKNRARQRTGSPRRRATARTMETVSEPHRSRAAGVHRRDVDEDQHGAAQGVGAAWP